MRGSVCPRCRRVVRIRKNNIMYQHNTEYGRWCAYSGVTLADAENKITNLARRCLNAGLVKNSETGKWEHSE